MNAEVHPTCDECGSRYRADASVMASLCPECAHLIYGTPRCEHHFAGGRCTRCGWDGSTTRYTRDRREQD